MNPFQQGANILFEYLRNAIYSPAEARLNIDKLPVELKDFGKGLQFFVVQFLEARELASALARGDLTSTHNVKGNEIAAPLKSLQASLLHLTWQAQQIAKGDYKQRVDFLGDFAHAFNIMVEQLHERDTELKSKIQLIQNMNDSLTKGNLVLGELIQMMPIQIILLERESNEVILINDSAKNEVDSYDNYIKVLVGMLHGRTETGTGQDIDVEVKIGDSVRYLRIKSFYMDWHGKDVEALIILDESESNKKIKELEKDVYRDSMTGQYNRTYGMLVLGKWVLDRKHFVLVFADLDSLKYVNDVFGHDEGDMYIINAAKHLRAVKTDAVVCRIGGDEFMVLVPYVNYDEALHRMDAIYKNFSTDAYLQGKKYKYSISFGLIEVTEENTLSVKDILKIADERMYENKRMRKEKRHSGVEDGDAHDGKH